MHQHTPDDIPHQAPTFRYQAGFHVLATACVMMQMFGCIHRPDEQTPATHKPPTAGTQVPPSPKQQPPRVEQPDKAKTVEKKSPSLKEKKSAPLTLTPSGKKPEQTEGAGSDTLIPPPPLKPPTFGGAGG
jgi:hypothetical protein